MDIILQPIAYVTNNRTEASDDHWGEVISEITLLPHIPEAAFDRITDFSQLEIIYYFDQVHPGDIVFSGHPRGNSAYPKSGIYSQRRKDRPNRLGLCRVQLLEQQGRTLRVKYLDAIHGTPVLDIKPVFREFELQQTIKQPGWVAELMQQYWRY